MLRIFRNALLNIFIFVLSEPKDQSNVAGGFLEQLRKAETKEEFAKVMIETNMMLRLFYSAKGTPDFPIDSNSFDTFEGEVELRLNFGGECFKIYLKFIHLSLYFNCQTIGSDFSDTFRRNCEQHMEKFENIPDLSTLLYEMMVKKNTEYSEG